MTDELSLLTYNVLQNPVDSPLSGPRRARAAARLVADLAPDVVVLNEVNGLSAAGLLVASLKKQGYAATPQVGSLTPASAWDGSTGRLRWSRRAAGGGVRVFSRLPILERHQHVYAAAQPGTWDNWANKGCVLVKLWAGESPLWVAATHLQADQSPVPAAETHAVRLAQLAEIRELVTARVPADQQVLIAGDLNVEYYSKDADGSPGEVAPAVAEAGQALGGRLEPDGPIHDHTFDGTTNPLAAKSDGPAYRNVLDYVGWVDETGSRPHPVIHTRTITGELADVASDHYPVVATVQAP
jgi:endonuclease/exonuclease/phosphatase family metal-dependent hydrolase